MSFMHALTAAPSAPTAWTAATAIPGPNDDDVLSAMRPALDVADQVGEPTDADSAATLLGTADSYVNGALATAARLDVGLTRRTRALEELIASGGDRATIDTERAQIELLTRLRDRINQSARRVSEIVESGDDRDTAPSFRDQEDELAIERSQRRREDAALLEQRRMLLADAGLGTGGAAPMVSDQVAARYRSARS